jgi:hypothetical protein
MQTCVVRIPIQTTHAKKTFTLMDEESYEVENKVRRVQTNLHKTSTVNCLLTYVASVEHSFCFQMQKTKLRGLSPRANYTDRAIAACRRS